jgi:glycosyltransferase involved in cell wall biosynthesis
MKLKIINIGAVACGEDGRIRHLKNYSNVYNSLADLVESVEVFSPALNSNDLGYEFLNDAALTDKIAFSLVKGNSPDTRSSVFFGNYVRQIIRLILFCRDKADYFVFLPSPLGAVAILYLFLFNSGSKVGTYVGGNWREENRNSQKSGAIRKLISPFLSLLLEKTVVMGALRSDFAITSSYEHYYTSQSGKKRRNLYLAPPLLNVDEEDLKEERKERNGPFVIAFCGELRPQKGCLDLMAAFRKVVEEADHRALELRFIGNGESLENLKAYACENGLRERVEFLGHIIEKEDLKYYLTTSDILVLPSYSEGFPRVGYECFTLGIPTILSRVGGIPFLVEDGVHTLLVAPGNIGEIAHKIALLLADSDLCEKLAANAKRLMEREIFPRIRSHGSLADLIVKRFQKEDAES